jgi:rod shape-determining protein MreC
VLRELGAPPAKGLVRSTGSSRNARRRRAILALLILASFTLITLDARRTPTSPVDPLRDVAASVFGPLESGASSAVEPVDQMRERLADVDRLSAENDRLHRENAELVARLRSTEYTRNRAAELDRLLRVAGIGGYTITPARVIAVGGAQSFSHTVTIDAGLADGVKADMTVLTGEGLVGRVVRSGGSTATVLLLSDRMSTVGGRLERSMALGFVSGRGQLGSGSRLDLRLLDLDARPAVGDRLVTWGSRGNAPYVAGVPIGTVVSVGSTPGTLGSTAEVVPFVDPTRIDTVGVVVGPPARNPRDAVLPPKPKAAR